MVDGFEPGTPDSATDPVSHEVPAGGRGSPSVRDEETNDILFADDHPYMRKMVADILWAAGYAVRTVPDGNAALAETRRAAPEMVILDYRMDEPDGFEVCSRLKSDARFAHIPVLILTAESQIENRLGGFQAGADDYLPKPFDPRELVARVEALLRLSRGSRDRNPTSGLPGGDTIRAEYDRLRRTGNAIAVCYFDLDYFKPFSDRFGFSVADAVIRELGRALQSATADTEAFAGHVGGDDFVILCDPEDARPIARTARGLFDEKLLRHVPDETAAVGRYRGPDRDGVVREFPLTRLSVGIVRVPRESDATVADIGETVSGVKQAAKRHHATHDDADAGIVEIELRDGRTAR